MANYDPGDVVRLQATVVASGGALTTPGSIIAMVLAPGTTVACYGFPTQIASVNAGGFYLDIVASKPGDWKYRFVAGPSVGLSAGEGSFTINQSAFVL